MTFIPFLAIKLDVANREESYLARSSGWITNFLFTRLSANELEVANRWHGERTLGTSCQYIMENWDELKNGQVIDVEYVLGEVSKPKISQRLEDPIAAMFTMYPGIQL